MPTPAGNAENLGDKPSIAIISNSQTPYRLHLHRRIASEIPEIKLFSAYTHETSNSSWELQSPPEIGPVLFGKGESCLDQDRADRALREWRRAGRIIRWMKQERIQFVVMMGYNDIGRMRMIRWCRRAGVPCFLFGDSNIHGDRVSGIKGIIKKIVVGWVVRSCAGIFSCGSLGKAYFIKYGANPERIFYFPYEPDYQLIENLSPLIIEDVRRRFNLDPARKRLVYSGRLISVKRVDLLVDAFVSIARERPLWDLVIVGDGPMKEELLARIPADLSTRLIWTGFVDDQSVVSAMYRLSDVLVLPSDYEPWALVINEAAAAGMAIVSSSVVGAAAELLRDGVNGRSFTSGNLSELTQAILEVTNESTLQSMKAASPMVLAGWRKRGDPVEGLRQAMRAVRPITR